MRKGTVTMMEFSELSGRYTVKRIEKEDAVPVYELEKGNPLFYDFCPPAASVEGVLKDMAALPPGKTSHDKYYVGFYEGKRLIAVMDLILGYPDPQTAHIGFFMMERTCQGKGIGSGIIKDVLSCIRKAGFAYVRLGYMKGNEQSRRFWVKNGFLPTGEESDREYGTAVFLQRECRTV